MSTALSVPPKPIRERMWARLGRRRGSQRTRIQIAILSAMVPAR